MFKKLLPWYLLGLVILSLAVIYGCGAAPTSGGGGAATANRTGTYSYAGTQTPGDVWSWIISTETFSGSNETLGFWVSGTWTTLPSGFGKAHVTSINGVATSEYAYFLEFPNTMLLVKPGGDDDKVIVCSASATMEPAEGSYSFINIPKDGWTMADSAYGTVEVRKNTGTGSFEFDVTDFLMTGAVKGTPHTETGYTWEAGRLTKAGPNPEIFMTPSNVFIADQGTGEGGFAGGKIPSPAFSSFELEGKEFRGVMFKYFPEYDEPSATDAIGATGQSNGTIHGGQFSNVDTDSTFSSSNNVTMEFTGAPISGVYTGNQLGGEGLGTSTIFKLIVSKVGADNKIMIMGFATGEYSSGHKRIDNFLVIEQ